MSSTEQGVLIAFSLCVASRRYLFIHAKHKAYYSLFFEYRVDFNLHLRVSYRFCNFQLPTSSSGFKFCSPPNTILLVGHPPSQPRCRLAVISAFLCSLARRELGPPTPENLPSSCWMSRLHCSARDEINSPPNLSSSVGKPWSRCKKSADRHSDPGCRSRQFRE